MNEEPDTPRALYLLGAGALLFVLYVWQAPIDWVVDWLVQGVPG